MTEQTQQKVDSEARESISKSLTEIEKIATLLPPLGLSTTNLARVIGSYLGGSELSFQSIQIKVAPVLFLALSTIPYLSQVSYISADGLLLSYHGDNDHAFATCSNASSSSVWYTQPVDRRTGQPFGEAVTTQSMISVYDSWLPAPRKCLEQKSRPPDSLYYAVNGRGGLVTAAVPAKIVVIKDGTALVPTLQPDGHTKAQVGQVSCEPGNGKREFLKGDIVGTEYIFHRSTIEIMDPVCIFGIDQLKHLLLSQVYVLSYPSPELASLVDRDRKSFLVLLAFVFVFIGVLFSALFALLEKARTGDMCSCTPLGQQAEATPGADCFGAKPQAKNNISRMDAIIFPQFAFTLALSPTTAHHRRRRKSAATPPPPP
ncbi:hypothetical protein NL676_020070 [Syzygium grande]|nr:hypothetical protein NL676_020070 [Syzygium grande]